ncbi:hypothetical protein BD626DRAFT_480211 [Schizophyllum amplum]|uniref:Uncharacterized protein n=1 Tax=Schizophyllum amplum TaxID=97359 RepID=A0A550CT06_9AGAR|nr:hypothetical protein BD626DRAFT_480211 [Auriculariopsis ampla]
MVRGQQTSPLTPWQHRPCNFVRVLAHELAVHAAPKTFLSSLVLVCDLRVTMMSAGIAR